MQTGQPHYDPVTGMRKTQFDVVLIYISTEFCEAKLSPSHGPSVLLACIAIVKHFALTAVDMLLGDSEKLVC